MTDCNVLTRYKHHKQISKTSCLYPTLFPVRPLKKHVVIRHPLTLRGSEYHLTLYPRTIAHRHTFECASKGLEEFYIF